MQPIYILAGAPGSGKSWISRQLSHKFNYIPHDTFGLASFRQYAFYIAQQARNSDKPVLCDTPFSLSQIMGPLKSYGFEVHPIFVIESEEVTRERYEARDHKPIPKGHITRIGTYLERAIQLKAPYGTSDEMLKYLQNI